MKFNRRIFAVQKYYSALSPQPSALSPQPSALSPQPSALSPQPSALSHYPYLKIDYLVVKPMESLTDILFHAEDVSLPKYLDDRYKTWIYKLIDTERHILVHLNFVFCSDQFLHKINLQYLDHDTYTDIITFDNSEEEDCIEGDIFISLERVTENARNYENSLENELRRVMAHGVLHLCGFNDKTDAEQAVMREKEAEALDLSAEYIL